MSPVRVRLGVPKQKAEQNALPFALASQTRTVLRHPMEVLLAKRAKLRELTRLRETFPVLLAKCGRSDRKGKFVNSGIPA